MQATARMASVVSSTLPARRRLIRSVRRCSSHLTSSMNTPPITPHFHGLRTVIYYAPDLDKAKAWYSMILGIKPYFDQSFYVGFSVSGYELGLIPDASTAPGGTAGAVIYWGVSDAQATLDRLISLGAKPRSAVQDVGDDIQVATVCDPFGNIFGIIRNPHFKLPVE